MNYKENNTARSFILGCIVINIKNYALIFEFLKKYNIDKLNSVCPNKW